MVNGLNILYTLRQIKRLLKSILCKINLNGSIIINLCLWYMDILHYILALKYFFKVVTLKSIISL